ncbi:MAG: hypothetical protein HKO56_03785 [Bacteroidia bacterium]|nr:hypothetical protein [Bacteroidia bacterium]
MKIINIVLSVVILLLAAYLYYIISQPIKFQKEKEVRYTKVIEQLKQIRTTQLAYKAENGKYSQDFNQLIDFAKNGQFTVVKRIGNTDDSTAVIVRDTTYISVKDSLFKNNIPIDSLPIIPFTNGAKFSLEAGIIEKGRVKVPVFEVIDTEPFDKKDVLKVGSMTEPTNAGNWE